MSIQAHDPLPVPMVCMYGCVSRLFQGWVGLSLLWLVVCPGVSFGLESARDHLARGYDQLLEARRQNPGAERDEILARAVKSFTKAYETSGPPTQVHVLIGAAQGYLLMQKSPRQFPFLWSASPVQRALRSVQHVLTLEPDNPVAHLLMGLVLRRQQSEATGSTVLEDRQQERSAWRRAAELGLRVQVAGERLESGADIEPFSATGVVLVLQSVDLGGEGRFQDVLWVYRPHAEAAYCYGMVRHQGEIYPLIGDPVTGRLAPTGSLDHFRVNTRATDGVELIAGWQQGGQAVEIQFRWTGSRFMPVITP